MTTVVLRSEPATPARATHRVPTRVVGLLVCAAAVAVLCFLSLAIGARVTPLSSVWSAIFSYDPNNADHLVIMELRLPQNDPRAFWSAPPSASPVPSCRGSPATRSPTPASSASTPARHCSS